MDTNTGHAVRQVRVLLYIPYRQLFVPESVLIYVHMSTTAADAAAATATAATTNITASAAAAAAAAVCCY